METPVERLTAALADRYGIDRLLGSGGMATVYLARDVKHDRPVALKVIRPELAAVLGVERFLSEIRVTAHLRHPHILPLFDSGEAAGLIYYVMPYIEVPAGLRHPPGRATVPDGAPQRGHEGAHRRVALVRPVERQATVAKSADSESNRKPTGRKSRVPHAPFARGRQA